MFLSASLPVRSRENRAVLYLNSWGRRRSGSREVQPNTRSVTRTPEMTKRHRGRRGTTVTERHQLTNYGLRHDGLMAFCQAPLFLLNSIPVSPNLGMWGGQFNPLWQGKLVNVLLHIEEGSLDTNVRLVKIKETLFCDINSSHRETLVWRLHDGWKPHQDEKVSLIIVLLSLSLRGVSRQRLMAPTTCQRIYRTCDPWPRPIALAGLRTWSGTEVQHPARRPWATLCRLVPGGKSPLGKAKLSFKPVLNMIVPLVKLSS